jgi:hypothetical protein
MPARRYGCLRLPWPWENPKCGYNASTLTKGEYVTVDNGKVKSP